MRDVPAKREVYTYQPYRRFQATALLVLAGGLALILSNQLFSLASWAGMTAGFLAAGVLVVMRSRHWPTIQPPGTITIDRERETVTFEGFRLKRQGQSSPTETGGQDPPPLAVRFEDVRDVYYHRRHRFSGGIGTLVHLDRDAVNRYFADSGNSNRRYVTLEVVLTQGTLMISLAGLKRPNLLAQRLCDIAANARPAELKTSPIYTRELTLGIGLVVAFAVLLAVSWDLKELWWFWLLLLAGGGYRLFLAVQEKRRHQAGR